jgi:hypothetical protein
VSKSKGNDRLAAERRRDLIAAGYRCSPAVWPGEREHWAAPGELNAWRSLSGAWRHLSRAADERSGT